MQPSLLEYAFDESKHPRRGKGDPKGGQFAPGGGATEAKAALALEFELKSPIAEVSYKRDRIVKQKYCRILMSVSNWYHPDHCVKFTMIEVSNKCYPFTTF